MNTNNSFEKIVISEPRDTPCHTCKGSDLMERHWNKGWILFWNYLLFLNPYVKKKVMDFVAGFIAKYKLLSQHIRYWIDQTKLPKWPLTTQPSTIFFFRFQEFGAFEKMFKFFLSQRRSVFFHWFTDYNMIKITIYLSDRYYLVFWSLPSHYRLNYLVYNRILELQIDVSIYLWNTLRLCYYYCVFVSVMEREHTYTNATVHMWSPKDNFVELILSFHWVGSRDWSQVVKLGGKGLYPLSTSPDPQSIA